MQTLAHWGGGGPGPWILLFPLIWAALVVGAVTFLRRTARRGGGGAWRGEPRRYGGDPRPSDDSPIAVLGRRFASGEIDEDEYWRRLSVLDEQFGPAAKGGSPG
ncbi:SHOCT domain-containing protein [Streptomyces brasiliscabiei]|uniref:SHOCT domain-containing protein n=1 Tax=Streptomyces brasiliscabiei TaxID=2736302 RepID=A0ABU8GLI7_9ACTN